MQSDAAFYGRKIRETRRQLTACNAAMETTEDVVLKRNLRWRLKTNPFVLKLRRQT